jgi:hypothetical protein
MLEHFTNPDHLSGELNCLLKYDIVFHWEKVKTLTMVSFVDMAVVQLEKNLAGMVF